MSIIKLLFLTMLLLSCNSKDVKLIEPNIPFIPNKEQPSDEPRCIYKYYENDKHELDSTIIECPELIPEFKPIKFKPLNIDSTKNRKVG